MDGEVLNYIYRAKYLFDGSTVPELMNGIAKSGMAPPAPLFVLIYRLLQPFWAYVICQMFVLAVGYVGMYFLNYRLTREPVIAFLTACLFIFLPFMPVYGLSILGQPLLILAFWNLYQGEKKIFSYILILIYGTCSSFALVGFAVLAVLGIMEVMWIIRGKTKKSGGFAIGILELLGIYILLNLDLVKETLKIGEHLVSHRTQMVFSPVTDKWGYFIQVFFGNDTYTPAYAKVIFGVTLFVIFACLVGRAVSPAMKEEKRYYLPALLLGGIFLLSLAALFTKSSIWTEKICASIKFLGYFQADRVSWLIPVIWYIIAGLDLYILYSCLIKPRVAALAAIIVITVLVALPVYEHSFFYYQIRQVIFPKTYHIMTWNQYYAVDIFEQMEQVIGKEKSEYRVVSLGLPPAAALYNGFYCLDGYSNNYALSYKEQFRKVIAPELAKNDALRCYFDDWGNRCYLVSTQSGSTPMIEKYSATQYDNLEIDSEVLKEMGGEYLFSAMKIQNAESLNLDLIQYFETDSSYYGIYLYKIL